MTESNNEITDKNAKLKKKRQETPKNKSWENDFFFLRLRLPKITNIRSSFILITICRYCMRNNLI
jgi:hypothetical protein